MDFSFLQSICFSFTTEWSNTEGVNEDDHRNYLDDFCTKFEQVMINLIDHGAHEKISFNCQASIAEKNLLSKVYVETLEHAHQCERKVARFYGRNTTLESIADYIQSDSKQPFVVYGESGCGKTSVLAKSATQVQ